MCVCHVPLHHNVLHNSTVWVPMPETWQWIRYVCQDLALLLSSTLPTLEHIMISLQITCLLWRKAFSKSTTDIEDLNINEITVAVPCTQIAHSPSLNLETCNPTAVYQRPLAYLIKSKTWNYIQHLFGQNESENCDVQNKVWQSQSCDSEGDWSWGLAGWYLDVRSWCSTPVGSVPI